MVLLVSAPGCVAALAVVVLRLRLEALFADAGSCGWLVDAFVLTALVEEPLKQVAPGAAPSARRA